MATDHTALLQEWHAAKQSLQRWEQYELELRRKVVAAVFGDYGDGSRTTEIGNGYKLTNLNATRHDVKDCPELRQLVRNFAAYEATADVGRALLKDKPRLSLRAYKALPSWGATMMVPFVTTTPQLPQLTITPPKG